jgi:hypothetical protein
VFSSATLFALFAGRQISIGTQQETDCDLAKKWTLWGKRNEPKFLSQPRHIEHKIARAELEGKTTW